MTLSEHNQTFFIFFFLHQNRHKVQKVAIFTLHFLILIGESLFSSFVEPSLHTQKWIALYMWLKRISAKTRLVKTRFVKIRADKKPRLELKISQERTRGFLSFFFLSLNIICAIIKLFLFSTHVGNIFIILRYIDWMNILLSLLLLST